MGVSAVIHTRNDAKLLPHILKSVSWADEIIVADMESTDGTQELAEAARVKLLRLEPVPFVEIARTISVSQARHRYVLLLDGDEIVPPYLASKLRTIAAEGLYDVVGIPRRNFIAGTHLDFAGWGASQDVQVRFFKPASVVLTPEIHRGIRIVSGARTHTIKCAPDHALQHFSYTTWSEFILRLDRYTAAESDRLIHSGSISNRLRLACRAFLEFPRRYIWLRGWRAGLRGFTACWLMATYHVLVWAKYREGVRFGRSDDIEEIYARQAQKMASEAG